MRKGYVVKYTENKKGESQPEWHTPKLHYIYDVNSITKGGGTEEMDTNGVS